jgi:serine/threonine protein kinase
VRRRTPDEYSPHSQRRRAIDFPDRLRYEFSMIRGERFGHYRLLERLAASGYYEVFLASHDVAQDQPECVIKRTHRHLGEDRPFIRALLEDVGRAAGARHPNLVSVLDLGETDGHGFVCMEYVPGIALSQLIRERRREERIPLTPALASAIVSKACAGLHQAHIFGSSVCVILQNDGSFASGVRIATCDLPVFMVFREACATLPFSFET